MSAPRRGKESRRRAAVRAPGDVTTPVPEAMTPPPAEVPPLRREAARMVPLAVLSGVLWFLSCASFDIWPLAWIAMVPALWTIDRASTRRRAILWAWIAGIVANAGGFYWIVGMLERFANLPTIAAVPIFLLLCAYQGVVFALFGWAYHVLRAPRGDRPGLPAALAAPVTMVTFELAVPFIFPWYLAITQAWQRPVIQVADLTGPLGVTALLLVSNGAIYDLVFRRPRAWKPAIGAFAVLALALVYGVTRMAQIDRRVTAAPKLAVGIVQPNVAFDQKARTDGRRQQLTDLQAVSSRLEREGAELIVWPETAYPWVLPRDLAADLGEDKVARVRRGFTVPLVMGALTNDDVHPHAFNSALLLDADGQFRARFDKIFLLMFGEYIPLYDTIPWVRKLVPEAAGQLQRGEEIATFPLTHDGREVRLGPMICYEDILPAFGRKLGALNPHLLVNLTNDAWFGDTSEPWEHMALSVYRAVELRTGLVRAVNTGVSASIDATGRVVKQTYAADPAITPRPADGFVTQVSLLEGGHTVYQAVGDLFGYLNAAALAILIFWQLRSAEKRTRRRGSAPPVSPTRKESEDQ